MTAFESLDATASMDSGHRFDEKRRWAASLALAFEARQESGPLVTRLTRARHQGPLRVQRPFYPEGQADACHVYLLHPPGGLVSGDELSIEATVGNGAHALLTTPAAAKLYKADSHGVAWAQHTRLRVDDGGILEWLPQETLCFDGSRGEQRTTIDLAGSARCLGWEIMALGRPASRLPFASGRVEQRFCLTRNGRPLWLERQPLDPQHPRFQGRWGQGGATVQATLWAVGLEDDQAVAALREALPAAPYWAVTQRHGVLLLRYLGQERNQAWDLCQHAWEVLRPLLTGRQACVPRIWLT
ncbi:urease accessory protein UreD 2 [Litchfieldella qijiaojingensis]|uniref:Urease accessory protein UreD n=1 Tax=Litchfieldella qijiaojingensis TaxID=980347 RepID=A0ABQ2YUD8_9GAMM|nr:urease accessory protein UreD [Halomonas qijiaojingensis]GGX92719.1 urease accessory protein UreD 2 [Halomonas qijiaojingensis]